MFPVRGLNITSKPIQPALHILCSRTFFKVSFAERVLHASSVVCLNSLRMKSECETTETELCDEFFNSSQNSFVRSLTKEEDVSLSSPAVHHLSLTSRESTSKYSAHLRSLKMSTIVCVSARLSKFSFSDAGYMSLWYKLKGRILIQVARYQFVNQILHRLNKQRLFCEIYHFFSISTNFIFAYKIQLIKLFAN